jgi:YVTN family beta-propeller protein
MIQGSFQTRIVNVNGRAGILEKFTGSNGTWDVQVNAYAEENAQGQPTYLGHTIQGVSGDTTIYVNMDEVIPKFRVFVSNIETGNVSAIDPLTFEIKTLNCTGTSCTNPRNLAANHDSSLSVYVPFSSSDNVFDVDADNPFLDFTNEIPGPDPESSGPYAAAFTCNGMEAWVVDRGDLYDDGSISIINTSTKDIENIYPACLSNPVGIAIANGKAYIANSSSDTVCVVDVATRSELSTINMGGAIPRHIVATPNGLFVYVSTNLFIRKIITSDDSAPHKIGGGAWNLGVTPDSSRVYAGLGNDTIKFIDVNPDPSVLDVAGLITVGGSVSGSKSIYGVTVTSDGSRIFATDQNNNVVYAFGPAATTSGSVNPMIIPNSLGAYLPQAITSAPGVRTEMCQTQNLCVPTLLIPVEGDTLDNACTDPPIPYTWEFSWDDNCEPDATEYDIEVTQVIGGVRTPLHATSTPDVFYPFSSLTVHSTSTPVEWRVRAVFDTIEGAWSAFRGFFLRPEDESCPQ